MLAGLLHCWPTYRLSLFTAARPAYWRQAHVLTKPLRMHSSPALSWRVPSVSRYAIGRPVSHRLAFELDLRPFGTCQPELHCLELHWLELHWLELQQLELCWLRPAPHLPYPFFPVDLRPNRFCHKGPILSFLVLSFLVLSSLALSCQISSLLASGYPASGFPISDGFTLFCTISPCCKLSV